MKTFKLISIFFLFATLMVSCGANDDDSNDQTCNQQGWAYVNGSNSGLIPGDIGAVHDPNAPVPKTEIFSLGSTESVIFIVDYLSGGGAMLNINNQGLEPVTATVITVGPNLGDPVRYSISGTYQGQPIEGEFCVTVGQIL